MQKIGLIAGNGEFPLFFAQRAKAQGVGVVAVGFEGITEKRLEACVDVMHWLKLGELAKLIGIFKKESVRDLVMAGQVTQKSILKPHDNVAIDTALGAVMKKLPDYNTNTMLRAFIRYVSWKGFRFRDSSIFLKEFFAGKGALTRTPATRAQEEDMRFGARIARKLADSDIGQTVVVKNKVIVAVEALEGTDETITRASRIAGEGIVIVKVARSRQDFRFDIPIVGARTIEVLAHVRGACLAVEAGRVLLLDKDRIIDEAEKNGVVLHGI